MSAISDQLNAILAAQAAIAADVAIIAASKATAPGASVLIPSDAALLNTVQSNVVAAKTRLDAVVAALGNPGTTGTPGAPVFTSAPTATIPSAAGGTFAVTATGSPTIVLTSGALSPGVSFVDNGGGNGTLAVVAGTSTDPSMAIALIATNLSGTTTQSFVLTIN